MASFTAMVPRGTSKMKGNSIIKASKYCLMVKPSMPQSIHLISKIPTKEGYRDHPQQNGCAAHGSGDALGSSPWSPSRFTSAM